MINLKELNEELNLNNGIDFETEVPYGFYDVQVISLQRRYEVEKQRERILVTYKIMGGDYKNCGLRDNYFLSEKVSRNSQIFQYHKMKNFFVMLASDLEFSAFEDMDQLEKGLPYYMEATKGYLYSIKYYEDENHFHKVDILDRRKNSIEEEIPEIHVEEF